MSIKTIEADSDTGGEVYTLLVMVHQMAGMLANQPGRQFQLKATQSDPMYGPILTVWTNGIVDLEARSTGDYHECRMIPTAKEPQS